MAEKLVQKFTTNELKKLVDDSASCVIVQKSIYNLQLYPYHLTDIASSIKEILNAKVAKYNHILNGILLGYKNLKLLAPQGSIIADSCYIHIDVEGDFYIFKPEIDSLITGIVNKKSDNHVGCLVHRLFNVSVPNNEGEDWEGHNVQIGDEVALKIIYMDLDARLPYIKSELVSIKDEESPKKKKKRKIKQESEENTEETETKETHVKNKKKRKTIESAANNCNSEFIVDESSPKNLKEIKMQKSDNNNESYANLNDSLTKKAKMKKLKKLEGAEKIQEQNLQLAEPKKRKSKEMNNQEANYGQELVTEKKKKRKSKEINNYEDLNNVSVTENKKKRKSKEFVAENSPIQQDKINNHLDEAIRQKFEAKMKRKMDNSTDKSPRENIQIIEKKKRKSKEINNKINDPVVEKQQEINHIDEAIRQKFEEKMRRKMNTSTDKSPKVKKGRKSEETINLEANKVQITEKKERKSKEMNDPVVKKKKKRSSQQEIINEDTRQELKSLEELELLQQMMHQNKSPKEKRKRKSEEHKSINNSTSSLYADPTLMADREDRKSFKRHSSKQNIIWNDEEIDLHDTELEKTLEEWTPPEDGSFQVNLVKIGALNASNKLEKNDKTEKRNRKSSEGESKSKKKQNKINLY